MATKKFAYCSLPDLDASILRLQDGTLTYNGPAGYGPRHARRRPRGPYWRGEVTPQFAALLMRKARKHGYRVVCDGNALP